VVTLEPENVQVVAGGSAQFNCSVSTDPSLTHSLSTTWLRNEKPIGKFNNIHNFNSKESYSKKNKPSILQYGYSSA
jgi:hypothetical protein